MYSTPTAVSTTPLDTGLTAAQVVASRAEHGSNALPATARTPWWTEYLAGFRDPTIIVLLAAAILAIGLSVLTGNAPLDGIAILIAVFIATTVGFFNEYRAEQDFERLKAEFERNRATVIRDGRAERITFDQVVVGDVVQLETGSLLPADGQPIRYSELSIDTAPIDGESEPKEWETLDEPTLLLRGYRVSSGTALMLVTAVGVQTAMWTQVVERLERGREADLHERTPLQERLDTLAERIGRYGLIAAIAILVALLARSGYVLATGGALMLNRAPIVAGLNGSTLLLFVQYLLVAITVVVVAVPEGLPLAVTVSLALSARNIARDNNLVRKPKATETIGQTNVICTDKTGTLTENRMTVQSAWVYNEAFEVNRIDSLAHHAALPMLALAVSLNATAAIEPRGDKFEYIGNATEAALLAWLNANGQDFRTWRRDAPMISQSAFSSTRKSMETIAGYDGKRYRLVKGAPELIIAQCAWVETDQGPALISPYRAALEAQLEKMSGQAMRTLAVAYEVLDEQDAPNLRLLALFGLADPIRAGVADAIRLCREAGIDVKMITGDNILTATAIAHQLDLIDTPDQVMLASDFRSLPLDQRRKAALNLRVLARAIPTDKEELVGLLQSERLVVTVTGDGVNDAPALQKADVGVAMGIRGTDIAKQASDIVLLDDNFRSIVRAVHWGRALFENIQRFIQFQLTINISALAIIFFSTLFGLTDAPGEPPLTVIQLLWINLIMDTLAVLALCLEPPTPEQMQQKPKGRTEPFITPAMWVNIGVMATLFTTIMLILIGLLHRDGVYSLSDSAIVFTTYVFLQVFNEINARSITPLRSAFQGILQNRVFIAIIILIAVIQVIITQMGGTVGAQVFRTTPLSLETWVLIILGSSTVLIVAEVSRRIRLWTARSTLRAARA